MKTITRLKLKTITRLKLFEIYLNDKGNTVLSRLVTLSK